MSWFTMGLQLHVGYCAIVERLDKLTVLRQCTSLEGRQLDQTYLKMVTWF